jgi:hypothetical protein
VCGRDVKDEKTYNVYPKHRPVLPPEKRGAAFFCRDCYDQARKRLGEQGGSDGAIGETSQGGLFPSQNNDSVAVIGPPAGGAPVRSGVESTPVVGTQCTGGEWARISAEGDHRGITASGSGAPCEPLVGAAGAQTSGKAVDLPRMLHNMVNNRFTGNALTEVDAYEHHINSVADGLFGMFLSAPRQKLRSRCCWSYLAIWLMQLIRRPFGN